MHGNNEHCLAAVRVFPDSVHLKGEPGNLQSSLCLPHAPLNLLTPPLKHMRGQFLISSNFQLPLLPRPGPRGGHQPVSIKLFSTSTAEQFLGLLCRRSSNETQG